MASVENTSDLVGSVMQGNMARVKAALAAGANVNGSPGLLPYTPIMAATARGDVDMINLLIEHRVDPDGAHHDRVCGSTDKGFMPGERALHTAAKRGNVEVVRLLKRGGADLDATDTRGRTPLFAACECLKDCFAVARVLLELGANPALADENGYTPLQVVAQHGVVTDLVDILYTGAPDTLNLYSTDGRTPLFVACVEGHESMVSRLVSLGAMQRMRPRDPSTCPLMMATAKGFVGVVRVLVNGGLQAIGVRSSLPSTIFSAIHCRRRAKILQLLLAADGEEGRSQWANFEKEGKSMLHYGAGEFYPAAVNVLLAAGANEAVRDSEGRFPSDVIGMYLETVELPMDRKREAAIRRMLERGPAYRARSWAWPAEDADGGGCGGGDAVLSSPPAAPKAPVSVRIFRPKGDRKFFVSLVDRFLPPSTGGRCFFTASFCIVVTGSYLVLPEGLAARNSASSTSRGCCCCRCFGYVWRGGSCPCAKKKYEIASKCMTNFVTRLDL